MFIIANRKRLTQSRCRNTGEGARSLEIPELTSEISRIIDESMSAFILRSELVARIEHALSVTPIVTLLGARQCGRTTIARIIAQKTQAVMFDLEDPADDAALSYPMLALAERIVALPLRSVFELEI